MAAETRLRSGSPPREVENALDSNETKLLEGLVRSASDEPNEVWVFGYGSLIWRPDMEYTERHRGFAEGYVRRFWQLSPDHRGTPEYMGRVCTMLPVSQLGATSLAVPLESPCSAATTGVAGEAGAAGLTSGGLDGDAEALPRQLASMDGPASPVSPCSPLAPEAGRVYGDTFKLAPCSAKAVLANLCKRERAGYEAYQVAVQCEDGATRLAWAFAAGPENQFFAGLDEDEATTAEVIGRAIGPSGTNLDYFLFLLHTMRARGVVDGHMERVWAHLVACCPAAMDRAREIATEHAASGHIGPKGGVPMHKGSCLDCQVVSSSARQQTEATAVQ